MDINDLFVSFGIGLATGISTLLFTTILLIPVSYMMNRYIYHHWMIRLMVGLLSVCLFPFAFIYMFFASFTGLEKAYYFGMFPLVEQENAVGQDERGDTFAFLFKIFTVMIHPFVVFFDATEYKAAIKPLLAKEAQAVVNEELFKEARDAASKSTEDTWKAAMAPLVPKFTP